ncbi:MAG: hypothetical protein ACLP6G_23060, partial [Terriglobales bacterium]
IFQGLLTSCQVPRNSRVVLGPRFGEDAAVIEFAAVGEFADAAVVGSAIVQIIENNPGSEAKSVGEFVKRLLVDGR